MTQQDVIIEQIKKIVSNKKVNINKTSQQVVNILHDNFPSYNWVGIYLVEGDDLVLVAWNGPEATEHTRIPVGKGICGSAAVSGKTELIGDVSQDKRYLSCFVSTKSEIVVPIKADGKVVGEIDIDSDKPNAFTKTDRLFLEKVALLLSGLPAGSGNKDKQQ